MAGDDEFLRQFNEHFRKMGPEDKGEDETPPEEVEARRARVLNEKEAKVMGVYQHPQSGPFVLLRDSRGRNLPIWIGEEQAISISLAIEGGATPRPLTHDLCKILIDRLGGEVDSVLIDDLYNSVYYAKLAVRHAEKPMEIDCRPSDAIAIGLRFRVPIYVADAVLEEGQWEPSEE